MRHNQLLRQAENERQHAFKLVKHTSYELQTLPTICFVALISPLSPGEASDTLSLYRFIQA